MSSPRPLKRQRIGRACDQCRRRKSKCDGGQPACRICQAAGRACSYEKGGGRRGLPTGYVRGLEATLGLIFCHIPNSEQTLLKLLRDRPGAAARNSAVDSWRRSNVASYMSQLSLQESDERDAGEIISDHEWEAEVVSDKPPDDAVDLLPPSHAQLFLQYPPIYAHEGIGRIDKPLPRNTADLIDAYFVHTHLWLPILERRDLLRAMYTYPQKSTTAHAPDHLVIWAVIAYASATYAENISTLDAAQISLAVQQQILSSANPFNLGHVRTLIILGLLHLANAKLNEAWILVGKATRMLTLLPESAREGRFVNTSNGCVFLDNMISALLDKAPSLSIKEQVAFGRVDEDDVEEWDTWALSRTNTARGPLRALSTLNQIQLQSHLLARILYHDADIDRPNAIIPETQRGHSAIEETHPNRGTVTATPPLLTLHLTSAFVTLTTIRHFELSGDSAKDSLQATVHNTLGLIETYLSITSSVKSSPLLRCVALQCQYSMKSASLDDGDPSITSLATRVSGYLQRFEQNQQLSSLSTLDELTPRDGPGGDSNMGICPYEYTLPDPGNMAISIPHIQHFSQTPSLDTIQIPYVTPISSVTNPNADQAPNSYQLSSLPLDNDGLDALFEELVTSLPTRHEPEFAQNLGFYDGDLDPEFMTQLQRRPNG